MLCVDDDVEGVEANCPLKSWYRYCLGTSSLSRLFKSLADASTSPIASGMRRRKTRRVQLFPTH